MFEIKYLGEVIKDKFKRTYVDDFVDKAHYIVTCRLLLLFSFTLLAKQIFGEPLSCLEPAEYSGGWISYVDNYCFVTSTYTLNGAAETMPMEEISKLPNEQKVPVHYYQWVPYMLLVQAALVVAPHLLWTFYQKTETDLSFQHVVTECVASRHMKVKERREKINNVVEGLVKTHEFRRVKENAVGLGSAGFAVYVLSKLLNTLNVLFQLAILSKFLGNNKWTWGSELIGATVDGASWKQAGYFPRLSFCTFKQGMLANTQTRTVQCVLMMNMINEKLFMVLYAWFVVLLLATIANMFYTIVRLGYLRSSSAGRYLQAYSSKNADTSSFAIRQLGFDGLLLLRFIEENAGFILASSVACKLYGALSGRSANTGFLNGDHKGESGSKRIIDGMLQKPTRRVGSMLYPEGLETKTHDGIDEEKQGESSPFLNPDVSIA